MVEEAPAQKYHQLSSSLSSDDLSLISAVPDRAAFVVAVYCVCVGLCLHSRLFVCVCGHVLLYLHLYMC